MNSCPDCRKQFPCTPDGDCWCKKLPHVFPITDDQGCRCPDCLQKQIAAACPATSDPQPIPLPPTLPL